MASILRLISKGLITKAFQPKKFAESSLQFRQISIQIQQNIDELVKYRENFQNIKENLRDFSKFKTKLQS